MTARGQLAVNRSFQLDLSARGYQVLFFADEINRCPGCGHSQWHVGRITAECGVCATALPLAETQSAGLDPIGHRAVALHVVKRVDRRRAERLRADGRTVALYIDGSPHPFALEDISSSGAKGKAVPGITEADSLVVELEDGRMIPAELRWCDGEFAGLAFVAPQDSAD